MRKILVALLLAASFASSGMADGQLTFLNQANHRIKVLAYDWDDSSRSWSASEQDIDPGSSATVTCRKSWFDANAPGCWIEMSDLENNYNLYGQKKLNNGFYGIHGAWSYSGDWKKITVNDTVTADPVGGSEVTIQKGNLPSPSGGTTDCIDKGTDAVLANNGIATLQWRSDGNLVLFDRQGIQWITGTDSDAAKMCFQDDGNLVIYRKDHGPWATGTDGHGATLKLQKDCNVVIQDANGSTVWQAGTHCRI